MRKPIFDIIRTQRGKGFSAEEVEEIDALLDRLGIEEDSVGVAVIPVDVEPVTPDFAGASGLDDPQAFFDSVAESGVLATDTLKPDQVQGLEAVVKAAKDADWPLAFASYALATACHETNYTMQPVREAYWLSENWRKKNLRYYPYYGRGYVQLTWKANYDKADDELSLDGRLKDNPDLALDPEIAAKIMAKGMEEGWFAGDRSGKRHTLKRHLPTSGAADVDQFTSARRIINGTDKNTKIAAEAIKFQQALEAGGW